MIPDYRVTITVKNNYLLSAMQEVGIKTAAELSRVSGVHQVEIGLFLKLKKTPYSTRGLRPAIKKLSQCLKKLPEDLFPPQHIEKPLKKNEVTIEIHRGQIEKLISYELNPQQCIEYIEGIKTISTVMKALPEKHQKVLRDRFGMDGEEYTLRETAKRHNVTPEAIRQIQNRALKKMRTNYGKEMLEAAQSILSY